MVKKSAYKKPKIKEKKLKLNSFSRYSSRFPPAGDVGNLLAWSFDGYNDDYS